MAAQKSKLAGINLYQEQFVPEGRWDKIYKWVVTTAKYLVLVAEILLVVAFGIRLVVDSRNNDLRDEIVDQMSLLQGQALEEQAVRKFALYLNGVNGIYMDNPAFNTLYEDILSQVPQGVDLSSLNISLYKIKLVGSGYDYETLSKLEENFKNNPRYDISTFALDQKEGRSDFSIDIDVNLDVLQEDLNNI